MGDSNIKLLLHCDGEDEGTTFVDTGVDAQTVTAVYDAWTGTTSPKFGTASAYCQSGEFGGYLKVEGLSSTLVDASFTLDMWFKIDDVPTGYEVYFWGYYGCLAGIVNTGGTPQLSIRGNAARPDVSAYLDNAWHHFALVVEINQGDLSDQVNTVYFDGEEFQSAACVTNFWHTLTIDPTWFACSAIGVGPPAGIYFDEIRFSDIIQYTEDFTPETSAYTDPPVIAATKSVSETITAEDVTLGGFETAKSEVIVATFSSNAEIRINGYLEVGCETSSITMTGLVGSVGELAVVPTENAAVEIAGVVDVVGDMVLEAEAPVLTITGITDNIATAVLVCEAATCAFSGITDSCGTLIVVAEIPVLTMSGTSDVLGIAELLAYAGDFSAEGVTGNSGVLSVTAQVAICKFIEKQRNPANVLCINLLKKDLVSTFSSYPFNTFAVINGVALGGNQDGLYQLVGETDAGNIINSVIKFPVSSLGVFNVKQLRAITLFGKSYAVITAVASSENEVVASTSITTLTASADSKTGYFPFTTQRVYFQLQLYNTLGAAFTLDSVNVLYFILGTK